MQVVKLEFLMDLMLDIQKAKKTSLFRSMMLMTIHTLADTVMVIIKTIPIIGYLATLKVI